VIDMSFFKIFSNSALINSDLKLNDTDTLINKSLPASYVPNRNALFLTTAHALAQNENIDNLIIGTTKNDAQSHPDASKDFIYGLNTMLNNSSSFNITLHTPLIELYKPEVFKFAENEGVLDLVINESHTCYENDHTQKFTWGYGCGKCLACLVRKQAWEDFVKNKNNE
jgi:7-cyano-7-deazaguanine synthase